MQVFDTNLDNFRVNTLELIGTRIYAGSKLRALVADPPYDTWTPHVIAAANHSVRDIVAGAANQIWFATDDGLFVTTDDANTFQPVTVGAGATKFIALARRDDGSIVAATDGGVWASDASGTTWRQLGLQGITINALLVRATTLVAATESGVFVTSDDGASWQSLPGLDTEHPRALALDPLTADLLVGTSGHGLWRTAQP